MKYGFTLLICIAGLIPLFAQQIPIFNGYVYQPDLYNPATDIPEGQSQIYLGHREYWTGFEDAPTSQYLMGRVRLRESRLSLGGLMSRDEAGLINSLHVSAFMGYQLVRSAHHRFATGISLGMIRQSLDLDKLNVADPLVVQSAVNISQADAGIGFWYKFIQPGWQIDFDVFASQIPQKSALGDSGVFSLGNHLLASLGWRIALGKQASIQPFVMYRGLTFPYKQKAGRFDLGMRAFFIRDRLWFGAGFRTERGGYHGGFGLRLKERLHLTASAELNTELGTSFEIGLGYTLGHIDPPDMREFKEPEPLPDPVALSLMVNDRLWKESVDSLPARPAAFDLFPILNEKGIIEYGFRFEDEAEEYELDQMAETESVVEHMATTLGELIDLPTLPELQGVDSIYLVSWLRESELELAFGASVSYRGDWGPKLDVRYELNDFFKRRTLQKGLLDGEELAFLKLYGIGKYLAGKLDVPESRMVIRLYTEMEMEPLRKTTVRVRLRK
ncbi:PorP/SprF family type IX secretion system membrane protein [bacterium]|nr:PorP/SprF family type IX secretion system membrane protein [bacterium]